MKKPNFFIIGAPKCGTTSLARWLGEHPNIFVSKIKEPHYFYTDGNSKFITIPCWKDYINLFNEADSRHYAIGEASVFYLFSKEAVRNILEKFPDAKFVILLRNPVEMAASLHWQEVYSENEHLVDFEKAWEVQKMRTQGKMITAKCKEPKHLVYGDVCKLGDQLERLFDRVTQKNIQVLFLEDIIIDPQRSFMNVLRFLEVDDTFITDFIPKNTSKSVRSKMLRNLLKACGSVKELIKIENNTRLLAPLWRFNNPTGTKPIVSCNFKAKLQCYFRADIEKLELITGRNLSHWIS